jgi:hypothetical protein
MRFLLSVIHNGTGTADAEEMRNIDAFNDRLREHGYRVIAEGVQGPETAFLFDNRNNADLVEKKPFIQSKEFLNGFWVIDVPNEEIAHELARDASKACNRKIELRPMYQ